ncbi:MAG: hypothetical protein KJO81_09320 [Gammaproteobacteria bacterium]|nr:hypothetical protein [Gammaproteobacteria bacterium]NNC67174.1 hypothetical protein [Gammaproteobacteria bacterium]
MAKQPKIWLLFFLWLCCVPHVFAEIRIFGLTDFDFGRWVLGAGPLQANANLCVTVSPPGAPLYQITAYGAGGNNSFVLTSAGNELPYRLFFNDRARPNGATEFVPGQALISLRARRRGGPNQTQCNRPNANISTLISDVDLAQIPAGRYGGTIILIVGPE